MLYVALAPVGQLPLRVRRDQIPNLHFQLVAGFHELPQRAPRRRKRVERFDRQAVLGVCANEVGKLSRQVVDDPGIDRLVDPRLDHDV